MRASLQWYLFGIIGAVLVFVIAWHGLFSGSWWVFFDDQFAEKWYRFGQDRPKLVDFFTQITEFGGGGVLNYVVGGVVLLLASRGFYAEAVLFLVGALANRELNIALKEQFQRVRPIYTDEIFRATSWSFPSGHAQNSLFIYGYLIYLNLRFIGSFRWLISFTLFGLVLAIGLSRLILGVHFVSDVLAGFAVGSGMLLCVVAITELLRQRISIMPKPG